MEAVDDAVRIRPATPEDVSVLLGLVAQYWAFERIEGFDPGRVSPQLRRLCGDAALGRAWIATLNGVAAGYLLAVYVFSLEHLGMTAEIDELFVEPAHRGHRLGERLLEAAEAEFVRAGCTNVSLQLGRGNDAARRFYRRHGYRERDGFELLDKMLER